MAPGKWLLFLLLSVPTGAQVYKLNPLPGKPQPMLNTGVTVTATPSSVNFNLAAGMSTTGDSTLSIGSSWLLALGGTVKLYAYFSSTDALKNQNFMTYSISSGNVQGKVNSGSWMAFSGSSAFATGSSLQVFSQSSGLGLLVSRTDTLSLQIDLTNQKQLPAGTYKGTLVIQAQAF